jgi:uncharacterized repeat protein (TIGR01451 family)
MSGQKFSQAVPHKEGIMFGTINRVTRTLLLAGLAAALAVGTAEAQTAEGTVITNIAVVNWTDANSNTYTPDSASVNVTVGFSAGVDVIAAAASVNPSSPSTGNTISFDIDNIGNGADSVNVTENITVGGIITVTGYRIDAGSWLTTLAEFNDSLSITSISTGAGNGITVDVRYDVASGQGGQSTVYQLTATSLRDGGVSDMDQTTINPGETLGVEVTPDIAQNRTHLPSNGTNYTFTFNVDNTGDGPEDFDLRALFVDASDVAIVSVNGVAGDSTQISLAASANQNIDVIYSVLDVAAGVQDTVFLRARSVTGPGTAADSGYVDFTVIRPAIVITKEACSDAQVCPLVGNPVPGDTIQYRVTVTNNGDAPASSVVVTDDLSTLPLTFDSTTDDGNWASIVEAAGMVTATLSGTLGSGGGSAFFWIRVSID